MATFIQNNQNGQQKGYTITLVGRFAFLASLAILLLFSVGCEKEENYSDIPEITYLSSKVEINKDFNEYDIWKCTIKFEFKDGDGDFGLETPDSTTPPEYRYNLFLIQFNKIKGAFIKAEVDTNKFTIPFVEPYGSNKQQKGIISVVLELFPSAQLPSDTIKYRFFVKDRALHNSDTIETKEIVFDLSQKLWQNNIPLSINFLTYNANLLNYAMRKVLIFLTLALVAKTTSYAQLAKVQAGFIYNFANYLSWQQDDLGEVFIIGVFGNTNTTDALRLLEGKRTIQNRPVSIKTYGSIAEIGKCNILYLPKDRAGQLDLVIAKIGSNPTIIISEKEGLAALGAGISFKMVDGKIAFEINQEAIKRQRIIINPKLVALAKRVY